MADIKVGDKLRVLISYIECADVVAGDILIVREVNGDHVRTDSPRMPTALGWQFNLENIRNRKGLELVQGGLITKTANIMEVTNWAIGDYVLHNGVKDQIVQISEVDKIDSAGLAAWLPDAPTYAVKVAMLKSGQEMPLSCLTAWTEPIHNWSHIDDEWSTRYGLD